jgi:hypothetical protein
LELIAKAREWPENLGAGAPYPIDIDDRLEDWFTLQCYSKLGLQKETQQTLKILASQLWPKTGDLNDSKPRPLPEIGTGGIIHALALKESGRANEAQELLTRWRTNGPDKEFAKWGEDVLAGHSPTLPPESQDDTARILYAWLEQKEAKPNR